jgi:V8-like Glu-specific endopeptidase
MIRGRTALGVLISALALAGLPAAAQNNRDSGIGALQSAVQNSIARLDRSLVAVVGVGSAGPMVVGTGFFVSNDGVFVTALHVLRQRPGVTIRALLPGEGADRPLVAVTTLSTDTQRDLALCHAALGENAPATAPLKLAGSSDVPPGAFVVLSGFPLGAANISSHFGIVSGRAGKSEFLEVALHVNEGESGAPIVRVDDGTVIGMASSVRTASTYLGSGTGVEEQNSGLTLAARAEWIADLIARAKSAAPPR